MSTQSAARTQDLEVLDLEPEVDKFRAAVVAGLSKPNKILPTAFLYDQRGSELFDAICELPEYYPTRTELAIMQRDLDKMAQVVGPEALVIEFGSGSGLKTRELLAKLDRPTAYVPVEISRDHLMRSAAELDATFESLEVLPVCADFTRPFELPQPRGKVKRRIVYFPGSTIGNFEPQAAVAVLKRMVELVGFGGGVLIGVDLVKDPAILEAAYNDASETTAAFNLNLLHRINKELGGNFDVDAFEHIAPWNADANRIEMLLRSTRDQVVAIGNKRFAFRKGEAICTEHSHKYTIETFAELAGRAGLEVERVWSDDARLFSVQYLRVA